MNKKLTIIGLIIIAIIFVMFYSLNKTEKVLGEEEAINSVIEAYPELAVYKTMELPPSSIKTLQKVDGWYVGFIQNGSGLPGIRRAECYNVSLENIVVQVGTYQPSDSLEEEQIVEDIILETCQPVYAEKPPVVTGEILPYGNVTLRLNQLATFKNLTMKVISIEEDSRCPIDVQCIQAGTVRVKVEVASGLGTSTNILTLGEVFTTEAEAITLTEVTPLTNSKIELNGTDYRFVFNVVLREAAEKPAPEVTCYVGGCSSQSCSDKPGLVTTCEYKTEYACYQSATCEQQSNGRCGWTDTPELASCLRNEN